MSIPPIQSQTSLYVRESTAPPRNGSEAEVPQESFLEKRLREASEGLERLRALPLRNSVEVAAEKVEMLKRRLEEIRMAMLFMTPEQAQAFARELKQIAGALSAAARNAGTDAGPTSGTGTAASASESAQALAAAISSGVKTSAAAGKQPEVHISASVSTENPSNPSSTAATGIPTVQAALDKALAAVDDLDTRPANAAETTANSAKNDRERLQELLKEASTALRAALGLLKNRLEDDEEGRKLSKELTQAIEDLDNDRTQLSTSGLYDVTGAVASISGLISSLGVVNIRV